MQEIFKQFDNLSQVDIGSFYNSKDDIALLFGANGCGKSEIAKRSLNALNGSFLTFHHNCFEYTTINDFLLIFYDTFKKYARQKKIFLKKTPINHFSSKIISYFKETNHNFLITVDNFELVSNKKEIVDFLFHIASFENVKLVLISQNKFDFSGNKSTQKVQTIEVKANTLNLLSEKIRLFQPFILKADIDYFFSATGGSELYLRMTLSYLKSSGMAFTDFIKEFQKKRISFEDFLINKLVSIVPENYFQTMKNFSLLHHPSSEKFLSEYLISKPEEIEYLFQKMVLTSTSQGYYLKNYLRNFFMGKFSVQERIASYQNLISIYEKELSKSPQDRLLRLSRESIRNLISFFSLNLPKINLDKKIQQNLSYMSQTNSNIMNWSKSPELKKNNEIQQAEIELTPQNYIQQAEEFEKNYNFQSAIDALNQAKFINNDEKMFVKILLKLSKNYLIVNNFDLAISAQSQLLDLYKNKNQPKFYHTLYKIGSICKEKFDYKNAIEYFNKVLKNKNEASKITVANTLVLLGEICEEGGNFDAAFENYQEILKLLPVDDEKTTPIKSCAYYKIAQIYDNKNDYANAIEFYKKNISSAKMPLTGENLGLSYLGLAEIYYDRQEFKIAIENYNLAIKVLEEMNNFEELYFVYEKLAQNFKYSDDKKYFSYLKNAKFAAEKLKDNFKRAYCLVEIGDYYYNTKQDNMALANFLEAKSTLGNEEGTDNIERINLRIQDMQIKMPPDVFEEIIKKYEQ